MKLFKKRKPEKTYKRCVLRNAANRDEVKVSWVPSRYAAKGKFLDLNGKMWNITLVAPEEFTKKEIKRRPKAQ